MNNRENAFEKDPQLRKNDSLSQKSPSPNGNKWQEAMRDVPSFSEHMKQLNAKNATNQNAIKLATKGNANVPNRSNAFSKMNCSGRNNSHAYTNNAIKSASSTPVRSSSGAVQSVSVGHSQSASKSK